MNKKLFNPNSKTHWIAAATGIVGGLMTFLPTVMQFIPNVAIYLTSLHR
jgi:hypothetical protein